MRLLLLIQFCILVSSDCFSTDCKELFVRRLELIGKKIQLRQNKQAIRVMKNDFNLKKSFSDLEIRDIRNLHVFIMDPIPERRMDSLSYNNFFCMIGEKIAFCSETFVYCDTTFVGEISYCSYNSNYTRFRKADQDSSTHNPTWRLVLKTLRRVQPDFIFSLYLMSPPQFFWVLKDGKLFALIFDERWIFSKDRKVPCLMSSDEFIRQFPENKLQVILYSSIDLYDLY